MKQKKNKLIFIITISILFVLLILSLFVGKYSLNPLKVIFSESSEMDKKVFLSLRLPRTVFALICGIALGISGCVCQTVFKNPLASPDIIGVANGANLGSAVAIVLISSSSFLSVAIGSFLGGIIATIAVILIAKAVGSNSTSVYVLSGIIINAISSSLIIALKYFADPNGELQTIEYWEMGTLSAVTSTKLLWAIIPFILSFTVIILLSRQIEMLSLSDNECKSLGVRVKRLKTVTFICSTLLVSSVISITGLISFVGLIAPHIARIILKKTNKTTMYLSAVIGGIVLLFSDILVRAIPVSELPISIFTSVIGIVVLFLFLLNRKETIR